MWPTSDPTITDERLQIAINSSIVIDFLVELWSETQIV